MDGVTEVFGREGVYLGGQSCMLTNGTIGAIAPVPNGEIAIRVKGTNAGTRLVIRDINFVGTSGSSAPLISVEEPLNDSTIVVRCFNAGTFLDLYTGNNDRLGTGNFIWVTTAGTVTKAINLDSTGWDDDNNKIYIDGVLQTSP